MTKVTHQVPNKWHGSTPLYIPGIREHDMVHNNVDIDMVMDDDDSTTDRVKIVHTVNKDTTFITDK